MAIIIVRKYFNGARVNMNSHKLRVEEQQIQQSNGRIELIELYIENGKSADDVSAALTALSQNPEYSKAFRADLSKRPGAAPTIFNSGSCKCAIFTENDRVKITITSLYDGYNEGHQDKAGQNSPIDEENLRALLKKLATVFENIKPIVSQRNNLKNKPKKRKRPVSPNYLGGDIAVKDANAIQNKTTATSLNQAKESLRIETKDKDITQIIVTPALSTDVTSKPAPMISNLNQEPQRKKYNPSKNRQDLEVKIDNFRIKSEILAEDRRTAEIEAKRSQLQAKLSKADYELAVIFKAIKSLVFYVEDQKLNMPIFFNRNAYNEKIKAATHLYYAMIQEIYYRLYPYENSIDHLQELIKDLKISLQRDKFFISNENLKRMLDNNDFLTSDDRKLLPGIFNEIVGRGPMLDKVFHDYLRNERNNPTHETELKKR